MNGCHLEEDGAYYIAQGVVKNKKLRTLNLSYNRFGDEGLQNFTDIIFVYSFPVEHLDLSSNNITDKGA